MIGKLQRVPLREVWKQETAFIKWLEENIDVLNDALDLSLSSAEREKSAGDFSVDLVADDADGNTVVIECQLEKSDHDHLGKLITYLTSIGARIGIWITKEPKSEHVGAVSWLNESSSADFYLVKAEAVKIGGSDPAPLLTLIVGPSEEGHQVGETKKKLAERHLLRREYWSQLLERAKKRTRLHAAISPSESSYVATSAGKRGLMYSYVIRQHEGGVELYIDRGAETEDESKAVFDSLAASKAEIEKAFGEPLEWQRLEGKRACRIAKRIEKGGYRDDRDLWPGIQDAMIDAMIRLESALKPHVGKLKV